jgi:mycothiol synthase
MTLPRERGADPTDVVLRKYRDGDLEAIVDLINQADAVDHLDEATDASTFREVLHRPDFDPYSDAFVVLDEFQNVVGHARLDLRNAPRQARFYAHTVVHPDWRDEPVEELLLQRLWNSAQQRRRTLGSKPAQFRTYCAAHQEERRSLFESFGLRPVRYELHMVVHPLDDVTDPAFPPGIRVRPYVRGQDDESALEVVNAAFADVMDFAPVTLEDFEHWIGSPSFRDHLSFVTHEAQEMIGVCLCTLDEGRADRMGRRDGTVESFCVRREHRRRGVGLALLLRSLHAFKDAGLESATLDTATKNPTPAIRLYERAGFREAWRWITYGTEMGPQATWARSPS